jgi:arylsulfatase A-like enzyme
MVLDARSRVKSLRPRQAVVLCCWAWAAVCLLGLPAPAEEGRLARPAAEGNKPNIVFIICDDLRCDTFGFMQFPHVETPNVDRLAKEGVTFTNAFVNTAICGPSRYSFWPGGSWTDTDPEVEQLFDQAQDPDESRNLHTEPAHAEILQNLKRRRAELRELYYPE